MNTDILGYPFHLKIRERPFFIVLTVVVVMIITDTAILRISVFLTSQLYRDLAIGIFVLLSIALITSQILILRYIHSKMKESEGDSSSISLRTMRPVTVLSQYAMLAVVVILIVQIMANSYFQTMLLTAVVTISYSVSIIALSLLTFRFLKWYASDRNRLIFAYGIASLILVLNSIFTMAFAVTILNDKNPLVVPHVGVSVLNLPSGSLKDILNQIYTFSSVVSFVVLWIATNLQLHYYSRRFGRTRYWTILGVPLAYFLTQFAILFVDVLDPLIEISPTIVSMILTIAFTVSKPAGGVLFGIAFWIIARRATGPSVKNYLTISAYGLILFFASNQAVVLVSNTFYPPFGLGSVSYVGISSYLILIGIFFSAASIAQDRKILANIRKSALDELKLLESMGSSEKKEKLVGMVTKIAKKNQAELVEASGVQSSLGEDEMKNYLNDVIGEIETMRNKHRKDD